MEEHKIQLFILSDRETLISFVDENNALVNPCWITQLNAPQGISMGMLPINHLCEDKTFSSSAIIKRALIIATPNADLAAGYRNIVNKLKAAQSGIITPDQAAGQRRPTSLHRV